MSKLTVIVPVYNEAAGIRSTLNALLNQSCKNFDVILCDNNSTDDSIKIIADWIIEHDVSWKIIKESQKGTGSAADTACRAAIADGANYIARTDADCIPKNSWIQSITDIFTDGDLEFIAGITPLRRDDIYVSNSRAFLIKIAYEIGIIFGKIRPINNGREYLGPYIMVSGNNLAITSELYLRVGGFNRTSIEETHEDRDLILKIRKVTTRYAFRRDVVVFASGRRVKAWGIIATLQWYRNHKKPAGSVDIR